MRVYELLEALKSADPDYDVRLSENRGEKPDYPLALEVQRKSGLTNRGRPFYLIKSQWKGSDDGGEP